MHTRAGDAKGIDFVSIDVCFGCNFYLKFFIVQDLKDFGERVRGTEGIRVLIRAADTLIVISLTLLAIKLYCPLGLHGFF